MESNFRLCTSQHLPAGPISSDGQPLPREPRAGQTFEVHWMDPVLGISETWRIVRVTSSTFTAKKEGLPLEEHARHDWEEWLFTRMEEGLVRLVTDAPPPRLTLLQGERR